ncbi:hypothetical protein CMV_015287 [Castanea mollissima]|uniref:Uncharacterized protein n=1 Tax=Castanea mollissima TaxID=60419 RepID=A0A8J4VK84_9ROSI|nr:hypothetical protein CMV_015287 [Castanea mollissima]
MFRGKAVSNIVKVFVILALLIFNIESLKATRPFDVMKSKLGTIKVSVSQDQALTPPSAPDPCTYIPEPDAGVSELSYDDPRGSNSKVAITTVPADKEVNFKNSRDMCLRQALPNKPISLEISSHHGSVLSTKYPNC